MHVGGFSLYCALEVLIVTFFAPRRHLLIELVPLTSLHLSFLVSKARDMILL